MDSLLQLFIPNKTVRQVCIEHVLFVMTIHVLDGMLTFDYYNLKFTPSVSLTSIFWNFLKNC